MEDENWLCGTELFKEDTCFNWKIKIKLNTNILQSSCDIMLFNREEKYCTKDRK